MAFYFISGSVNMVKLKKNKKPENNLAPKLNQGEYVFCTVLKETNISNIETVATFLEREGKTLVLKKEIADSCDLHYESEMSWITLNVYSSLQAVGLTAIVSSELAKNNISCNVIAAYYHDHIFVPKNDADRAIKILGTLDV